MANGATRRASSRPLWPRPTMPSVRPWISLPITAACWSQRPWRVIRSCSGKPLGQGQHEEQGGRGGRVVERHRGVEDGHAVLGAGGQVDLVVARARAADHHQVCRARCKCAALHPGTQHDQAVDALRCDPA